MARYFSMQTSLKHVQQRQLTSPQDVRQYMKYSESLLKEKGRDCFPKCIIFDLVRLDVLVQVFSEMFPQSSEKQRSLIFILDLKLLRYSLHKLLLPELQPSFCLFALAARRRPSEQVEAAS